ncbi:MAG: antitoxin AF2212-like protein [Pirellulales bacterium]
MTHDVDAIYSHGMFRPIEPLALPDGTRVHLRVQPEFEGTSLPGSEVRILSPRLAHPEQSIDFQMEVRDINGVG